MIWKEIPGFYGFYSASDEGLIKRNKKTFVDKLGKKRMHSEKILIPWISCGYESVSLSLFGVVKKYKVHRLIMIAFRGHSHLRDIDHADGNKRNNFLSNLRYCTHRQNNSFGIMRKPKSSQFIGVYWSKSHKKWAAHIQIKGKINFLGRFDSEQLASDSYQNKLATLNDL